MHGTIGTMQVLDSSGHLTITWNRNNQTEVEHAQSIYEEYTGEKGYSAFRVSGADQQGARLNSFDERAEKIMLVPQLRGG